MSRVKYAIKVELDREGFQDLQAVKEWLGLKNYSEVLRHLIREKAREIRGVKQLKELDVTAMASEEVSG